MILKVDRNQGDRQGMPLVVALVCIPLRKDREQIAKTDTRKTCPTTN